MNITLPIPDDLADRLSASGDLARLRLTSFRCRAELLDALLTQHRKDRSA